MWGGVLVPSFLAVGCEVHWKAPTWAGSTLQGRGGATFLKGLGSELALRAGPAEGQESAEGSLDPAWVGSREGTRILPSFPRTPPPPLDVPPGSPSAGGISRPPLLFSELLSRGSRVLGEVLGDPIPLAPRGGRGRETENWRWGGGEVGTPGQESRLGDGDREARPVEDREAWMGDRWAVMGGTHTCTRAHAHGWR